MRDQFSRIADDEDALDWVILSMLLAQNTLLPWATEEIAREIGDPVTTEDSIARLYGAGLVHRLNGFVFPTRAAVRLDALRA